MLTIAVVIINTHKLTLQADTKTHFTAVERLIEDESVLLHHLLSMVPKVIFSGTILSGRGKYTMTHNMSLKQRFLLSTAVVLVVITV